MEARKGGSSEQNSSTEHKAGIEFVTVCLLLGKDVAGLGALVLSGRRAIWTPHVILPRL
jgi:hypothetical protein